VRQESMSRPAPAHRSHRGRARGDGGSAALAIGTIATLFALLCPCIAEATGPPAEPARVLALFECQARQPICIEATRAIETAFTETDVVQAELYFDYLDLSRLGTPSVPKTVADYLATKYAARPPTLVIANSDAVATLLVESRSTLWPSVPIVAYALERPHPEFPEDIAQLATPIIRYRMADTVAAAMKMVPGARSVVYVGGSGTTDQRGLAVFREEMRQARPPVPHVELVGLPMAEALKRVSQLPTDSVVYTFGVFVDGAGRRFVANATVGEIAAASNRPVFILTTAALGTGAVGGFLTDFGAEARTAAEVAIGVLGGGPSGQRHAVEQITATPIFDWRQLRRWGIDPAQLPPGSVIRFREPSFLGRYWWWLVLALIQAGLIAGLLLERRQRLRVARAAAENESLNRSVIASLSGLIAVVDRAAAIIQVNAAWRDHPAGGPGTPLAGAAPGENCRVVCEVRGGGGALALKLSATIDRVLRRETPEASFDYDVEADGEARWFRWMVQALDRPEGGAIISLVDVTARKLVELESRRSLQEIAHATRVTTMGELATSLAHEINQPLAAILTNAQVAAKLLRTPAPDLDLVREVLDDIASADRRASEVIRRMRTMLRKGDPVRAPVDLNEIVRDVLALLGPEARLRHVKLDAALADPLPLVSGDPVQLQQVVINLVVNALDALGEAQAAKRRIRVRTHAEDRWVGLHVEDDGPGVPAAALPRVFEPFFTTKPAGLGMGLAIIKSIVEAHSGHITAANQPDGGASFRCRFPVRPEGDN
jgi:signal transduction histidine kinase